MAYLVGFLVVVWLLWLAGSAIYAWLAASIRRLRQRPSSSAGRSTPPTPTRDKTTFRPSSTRHRDTRGIQFTSDVLRAPPGSKEGVPSAEELEGLRDAFTGEPLNLSKGLYRCNRCRVYYHAASYAVLVSENSSHCVSCGTSSLASVTSESARQQGGVNYDPNVVTLASVRAHVGRVVTFEGHVHQIYQSRRGTDYAVMFENASWTKGFKLVFFRGSVERVGGEAFIYSLNHRTVKVRGLVVSHPRFGLEILVSERPMILSVR
jgi:hypothetical protein